MVHGRSIKHSGKVHRIDEFARSFALRVTILAVSFLLNGALGFSDSPKASPVALQSVGGTELQWKVNVPEPVLKELNRLGDTLDVSSITDYLNKHKDSPYAISLLLESGIALYEAGSYSQSLELLEQAWRRAEVQKTRNWKEDKVVAQTAARLGALYARLGRLTDLKALLAAMAQRPIEGAETLQFTNLGEAVGSMENFPEHSFKCGSLALGRVFTAVKPAEALPQRYAEIPSTPAGFSLADIEQLGEETGLSVTAIQVKNGDIPLPSVVHWKAGHYAAVIEERNGRYLVEDPTFQRNFWMSREALEKESSGFFVVPRAVVKPEWSAATQAEKTATRGKGAPSQKDSKDQASGRSCPAPGLPQAGFSEFEAALEIRDMPLFYQPALGPSVQVELSYVDASMFDNTVSNHGHTGKKWMLNWNRYVSIANINTAGGEFLMFREDGKSEAFPSTVSGGVQQVSKVGPHSLSKISVAGPSSTSVSNFTRNSPDGSAETFGFVADGGDPVAFGAIDGSGGANSRYYLAEKTDPQGNKLRFKYITGTPKLKKILDALNQETTVYYSEVIGGVGADNPARKRISAIQDPFGRVVRFEYDAQDRLTKLVDVEANETTFAYAATLTPDFITSMTTPYGTTHFVKHSSSSGSGLTTTDPEGLKETVVFRFSLSGYPLAGVQGSNAMATETPATPGIVVANSQQWYGYLYYGVTLHWDKKANRNFPPGPDPVGAPINTDKAHQTRWAQRINSFNELTGVPSSRRPALSHREWYLYEGQPDAGSAGISNQPTLSIRRIVDAQGVAADEIHRYAYNEVGNLKQTIDSLGREVLIDYAANKIDVVSIRRKRGAVYETILTIAGHGHDAPHRPRFVTSAAGRTTEYRWTSKGQLKEIIDPLTRRTVYTYQNDYLQKVEQTHPTQAGNLVQIKELGYDAKGRINRIEESDGYELLFEYDNLNRLKKVTYPDSTTEVSTYEALSLKSTTDRLNRTTRYGYNGNQQLTAVLDPANRVTAFDWCSCGSLKSIVDGNGRLTIWRRDLLGRITEKEYADGRKDVYGYHPSSGWLASIKTAADAAEAIPSKKFNYHLDGQLAGLDYRDATTPDVAFTYDPADGRRKSMTDGIGLTEYTYRTVDGATVGADQLWKIDGPLSNDTQELIYDALGRNTGLRILSDAGATQVERLHGFDGLGRLESSTNPLGTFTHTFEGFTSRVSAISGPGAFSRTFGYYGDAGDRRLQTIVNRVSAIPAGLISEFDYTYDATGKIKTWGIGDGTAREEWAFGYDRADELESALRKNAGGAVVADLGWRYDRGGNIKSFGNGSSWAGTEVNSVNQLLQVGASVGGKISGTVNEPARVSVQGQPSLLRRGATGQPHRFEAAKGAEPNAQGQFSVSATDTTGNPTSKTYQTPPPGGLLDQIEYDADGNTVGQVRFPGQPTETVTRFKWDGAERLVGIERGPVGAPVWETRISYDGLSRRARIVELENGATIKDHRYLWVGLALFEERNSAGTTVLRRFYDEGEQRIGGADAGLYYYFRDHLGSVREMVDDTGTPRARYDYSPWGGRSNLSGNLDTEIAYTGHWYHANSELHLAPYRAYDAGSGRWLSRDPIEEEGGLNLYGYVINQPTTLLDPLGLYDYPPSFIGPHYGMNDRDRNHGMTDNSADFMAAILGAKVLPRLGQAIGAAMEACRKKENPNITISEHGFRDKRIPDADKGPIKEAIIKDIIKRGKPRVGESMQEQIVVNGSAYTYRAQGRPGGVTHVGTVFPGVSAGRNISKP